MPVFFKKIVVAGEGIHFAYIKLKMLFYKFTATL